MIAHGTEDREKVRRDRAKRAVALAMRNRWQEAATLNRSIVAEFPDDMEAYNRLGKALSELGRNLEARSAFQSVLKMSPNNAIAKKNLSRLMKLADQENPKVTRRSRRQPHMFIEDSGKAGVTSLNKLASTDVLLQLTPGDLVQLDARGTTLNIADESGTYVGRVEPKVGSRIARLIRGGNTYEATVTSVDDNEVTVIIGETYKSPSQASTVSFPSRGGADLRVYVPGAVMGYDVADDEGELAVAETIAVKDWSNDDTEPGDDEAFSPVVHRIINSPDDEMDY